MDTQSEIAGLLALHDQDLEDAKKWWRSEDALSHLIVFQRMNQDHADPVDEVVSRFALIGFMTIFELMEHGDNQHETEDPENDD